MRVPRNACSSKRGGVLFASDMVTFWNQGWRSCLKTMMLAVASSRGSRRRGEWRNMASKEK